MTQAGDAEFAVVYPHLFDLAHATSYKLVGASHADDIAQETLTRCYSRFGQLSRRGSLEAWVSVVAGRIAIDLWRRARRPAPARHADAALPDDELASLRADLTRALATLSARQRDVVILRYVADVSEADACALLNLSAGSVKQHAVRGLAHLREVLGDRYALAAMPDPEPGGLAVT